MERTRAGPSPERGGLAFPTTTAPMPTGG
jgi:hypothetical protein